MSWCHRLIAHDWLLSVCRPHPATSSTFVFDRPLRKSPQRLSRITYAYRSLFRSFSLLLSHSHPHFFSVLQTATRDIVPFVLGSMPQLTSRGLGREEKKIGRHDGETVSTQGRERRHGLTDLLRRPRTDTSHTPHFFSSLFAGSPALPTTLSPNVIRDLRRDGRALRGFNRVIHSDVSKPIYRIKGESRVLHCIPSALLFNPQSSHI